jgi:hypothetical protein
MMHTSNMLDDAYRCPRCDYYANRRHGGTAEDKDAVDALIVDNIKRGIYQ